MKKPWNRGRKINRRTKKSGKCKEGSNAESAGA
jgi:hypothetical protein